MRRHLDSYTLAGIARMARGQAPWPEAPAIETVLLDV
jgi:hypothetical protein